MHRYVRYIAIAASVIMFFVMAFVSFFNGAGQFTCTIRALQGAVITYIAVLIAARVIINILINELAQKQMQNQESETE